MHATLDNTGLFSAVEEAAKKPHKNARLLDEADLTIFAATEREAQDVALEQAIEHFHHHGTKEPE